MISVKKNIPFRGREKEKQYKDKDNEREMRHKIVKRQKNINQCNK